MPTPTPTPTPDSAEKERPDNLNFFFPEFPGLTTYCRSHPSVFISLASGQPSISVSGFQASLLDMESNLSGLVPAAGLVPALPPTVTLGLTAAYTAPYKKLLKVGWK